MPEPFDWLDYLTVPPATPESLWELEDLGNVVEEVGNYDFADALSFIPSRLSLLPLYNLEKNINGGFKEQQYG